MSLTELLDGEVSGGDAIPDLDLEPSPLTSARRLAGSGSPLFTDRAGAGLDRQPLGLTTLGRGTQSAPVPESAVVVMAVDIPVVALGGNRWCDSSPLRSTFG